MKVRAWVADVLAGAYEPEPDEEIWEWAERTLRVPATENEEWAGRYWSSSVTPYVRELLEWAKKPGKGEFWIKKSSQVGFTMAVLILLCWMIVHRSGQVLYSLDSVDEARKLSKTRLQKWIKENDILAEMGEKEDDLSNLTYFLSGLTVYLTGAYSKGAWANKALVLAVLDELDKHPFLKGEGTSPALARERLKRPKNAKLIGFSTPGENGLITLEHARGTKEVLDVRCPKCGLMHPLEWKNLTFGTPEFRDLAGEYDLDKVEQDAYFACPTCGFRILEKHKPELLLTCQSRATNASAVPGVRSLHIWDAYSPFVTFGQLAVEWITAQGNNAALERFYRGRLAMDWQPESAKIKDSDLLELRGPYKRGEAPKADLLAMTVDLQNDVQKWVKFAFNLSGEIYVVDWGATLVLEEIIDVADEGALINGEAKLVECGLIDAGFRKRSVLTLCFENEPRFYAVRGRGGLQVKNTIHPSEESVETEHGWEQVLVYHIDDFNFKWDLHRLLKPRKKKENSTLRFFLPENVTEDTDFLSELIAEIPVREKNRYGHEKWGWKKTGPNDYQDCLKYGLALWAIMQPVVRQLKAQEVEVAV